MSITSYMDVSDLLEKYDIAGPRYTSYPTVPAWTSEVGPADYARSLSALSDEGALSLYFHLPFCENLCHFCGCTQVITKDHSRSASYVQTVLKEVEQVVKLLPEQAKRVTQIHFGGGTPNFLAPQEMAQLMETVRGSFNIDSDAEIAIELHPRTSTLPFNECLAQLGFNRISLGVQDLDPKVQALINRHQTLEMTVNMMEELRTLGFSSFNIDLVYGLPGQTLETWQKTLDWVYDLNPDRLAVYSYAHVPWIRPVQRTFADSDLPTPELKLQLFAKAYEFFLRTGYNLIGMDHFAKASDELAVAFRDGTLHRNFMGYSTRADAHQIGFGMSAISFVNGNYFQNQKNIKEYVQTIDQGLLATQRGIELSPEDHLRRDLIMRIMCNGFVDFNDFDAKWGGCLRERFTEELEKLKPLVTDRLLKITPQSLEVINEGFLFLRNVAMAFDPYLEQIRQNAKNPTFSRTV